MRREQMVGPAVAEGATITIVGWSTIEATTPDGQEIEIRAEIGHSGVELNIYVKGGKK